MDRNTSLPCINSMTHVALRKESVDRNILIIRKQCRRIVALRKESVDRNPASAWKLTVWPSRSPQGERG